MSGGTRIRGEPISVQEQLQRGMLDLLSLLDRTSSVVLGVVDFSASTACSLTAWCLVTRCLGTARQGPPTTMDVLSCKIVLAIHS